MLNQIRGFVPALLVALLGCSNVSIGAPSLDIPVGAIDLGWGSTGAEHIAKGYYSGLGAAERTVIEDQSAWAAAWAKLSANTRPAPPAPMIDFARYSVILVALGERGTGGYSIEVTRLASTSDYLYAEVTSTSPGSRCGTTQALTQPYDIVRIPRAHPPVVFTERSVTNEC